MQREESDGQKSNQNAIILDMPKATYKFYKLSKAAVGLFLYTCGNCNKNHNFGKIANLSHIKFKIKRNAYDCAPDIKDIFSFQNDVTYISKNDDDVWIH